MVGEHQILQSRMHYLFNDPEPQPVAENGRSHTEFMGNTLSSQSWNLPQPCSS